MRVFYTPRYYADIGEGHVFPIRKFELVRDRLLGEGTLSPTEIVEPREAALADVLLVHTEDYLTRLRAGALTQRELRRLGLPWSKALVRRSLLAASGTIGAAKVVFAEVQSSKFKTESPGFSLYVADEDNPEVEF